MAEDAHILNAKNWNYRTACKVGGLTRVARKRFGLKAEASDPTSNSVEHVGSGISRIRKALKDAKLNKPKFEFGTFFTVVFSRPKELPGTRGKTREKILHIIGQNPNITTEELAKETQITVKGVEWHLALLKKRGLLRRVGPDKGGYWDVVK